MATDVVLICGEMNKEEENILNGNVKINNKKLLHAHWTVLVAKSNVFAGMFGHRFREGTTNQIEISDIKRKVFKQLLRYLYTSKTNSLRKYAFELFIAADKYQIDELKVICEDYLRANLSPEIVTEILILAEFSTIALH